MKVKALFSVVFSGTLVLLLGVAAESAQGPVPFTMAGGTWWDRNAGETGTGFVWDPIVPGLGTIELIEISGPPGWNNDQAFVCGRYQPPGIAPDRAMCWELFQPVTGTYTATAEVAAQDVMATFSIDRTDQLETPEIIDLEVEPDRVTFQWTAPDDHLSFLVRVNPFPFDQTVTGEIVVPGSQRHAVVEAPMIPGQSYQAVVWGFSSDVEAPGPLQPKFLMASDSLIFDAPTPEASIHSVEFTQAIQEWQTLSELTESLQNDGEPPVPIVSGKPMAIRVYFDEVDRVTHVRVRLSGAGSAQTFVTLLPGCSPEMSRSREGNCRSANLYFVPPSAVWSATIEVFDLSSNLLDSANFTITSTDSDEMVLKAVRVCSERIENPSGSITWNCSPQERLGDLVGFLRSTAPTDEVRVEVTNHSVRREPSLTDYDTNSDGNLEPGELRVWWGDIARDIDGLFNLFDRFASLAGEQRYYYGMVRNDVPGGTGGIGLTPGRGAASRLNAVRLGVETNDEVVAHEVGHMLGRPHTNTGAPQATGGQPPGCYNFAGSANADWPYSDNRIQSGPPGDPTLEVGFDVASRSAIDPQNHFDWMGYCTPRWIAPFTYAEALNGLNPGILGSVLAEDSQFWLVSGAFKGGNLIMDPLFEFKATGSIDPESGSHRIDVLDSGGELLFSRFFTPATPTTEEPGEDGEVPLFFVELVPVQSGAGEIAILDSTGTRIRQLELGGAVPAVSVSSPIAGQSISGHFEITWTTEDVDSSSHTWRVHYSADGGASWQSLGANLTEPSLAMNFDTLPGSNGQALVRVFASDGVNTGVGVSELFSVGRKQPEARISFPENEDVFQEGELVWLQGFAFDVDDGFLDGPAVQWSSSIDGNLGFGAQLPVTDLDDGVHQITMLAMDSDGSSASDTISILVDSVPPELSLTAPPSLTVRACAAVAIDADDGVSGSGLASVDYSLNAGESWTRVPIHELPFEFIVPGSGPIHLIARAIDEAGHVAAKERRYNLEQECDDADLSVDKEGDPNPVTVGEELAYSIWVTNNGPLTAVNVQLIDGLPDTVEYMSAVPFQGSCEHLSGTITCELGEIAAGDWVTVDIIVVPSAPGTITNIATASSDRIDPDETNNTAEVATDVNARIDIWPFLNNNLIFLNKNHHIPVAILSAENFDAPDEVNLESPTFGKAGDEDSLDRCLSYTVDVNTDGRDDLICIFDSEPAGFVAGDTEGILTALLHDETSIRGHDSVSVIPPANSKVFKVRMSGENEVPPVDTEERGLGSLILTRQGTHLLYVLNVSQPMDVVSIHIHCGDEDSNGPVGATMFDGRGSRRRAFFGFLTAPDDANSCGWTDLAMMVNAMRTGDTYVNVHTQDYLSGEIRGQLEPVRSLWE